MQISMNGKGRYQGNIFVQRLWRTVKYEEVYLKAYASVLEAQRGLADYFRFYNGLRPHLALGYRTPAEVLLWGAECRRRRVLREEVFTGKGDPITGRMVGILTYFGPGPV